MKNPENDTLNRSPAEDSVAGIVSGAALSDESLAKVSGGWGDNEPFVSSCND